MTSNVVRLAVLAGALTALSACEDGFSFPGMSDAAPGVEAAQNSGDAPQTSRLVERDVEVPEVFQKTESGLWDGRPSLGGVWVAHPDVKDPERVIIRNEVNKKFVIGALFRRERDNPGPRLQVSSDAAEALGLLAGQPVKLNVTALRREEVAETPPAPAATATLEEPDQIEALSLDSPAEGNDAKEIGAAAVAAVAPEKPVATSPVAPTSAVKSSLAKPHIQIGIFSVKANADNTAIALRGAGMIPTVKKQSSKGKTFYSVTVGPAATAAERASLLKKVKGLGFNDAYFTSN